MILVTGATGFIGSHLVDELIRRRCQVRILVRNSFDSRHSLKGVETSLGDITDNASLISALKKIDVVFHLAAAINLSTESMERYREINVLGTENLFKAIKASDTRIKRFVFCSSVGVFGPLDSLPANEETRCNPVNFYELSKYEAEKSVRAIGAADHIPVSIIRPSWVYGPNDKRTFKLFRAINKNRFLIIGDGKTLVHPVYVSDVVQGLIKCAFEENGENNTYIIAGDQSVSLNSLVETIEKALKKKVPKTHVPVSVVKMIANGFEKIYGPLHRIPPISNRRLDFFLKNQAFDISKARRDIGYRPEVTLETGIQKTIAWYRDHDWL